MFRAAILILAGASVAGAHDFITTKITWSKEVSRLVYKRCSSCHREGGSAFAIITYEQARPWAKAIKEEALERRMPPWQAVKGFGDFKNDRGLTEEELEILSDWVEGGAPEGEPKYLPETPKPSAFLDSTAPPMTPELVVATGSKLEFPARLLAVRPKDLKKGASVQLIAERPDGTVEPLLWIYQFNPDFRRTYYYKSPITLPAGTQIEMSPPGAGSFTFSTAPTPKLPRKTAGAR